MTFTISPDAAFASVDDGAVVLHMRTKRYYSLNETGAFVWRRLEGGIATAEIVAELVREYDVTTTEAEAALALLVEELVQESLIHRAESV